MKMGSKFGLLLLTACLALPLAASAGTQADKNKADAKPKQGVQPQADCKMKSKVFGTKAIDTRKSVVTERQLQGATVKYNEAAAKKHGKKR